MEKQDFIKWARKLQETYTPNDRVRQELSQVDLVAIVGPTGVGKTSIIKKLGFKEVLSDVTRQIRDGEKNNRDNYFRSDYIQILKEIQNGEYVQFLLNASDEFYGTQRRSYPDQGICAMAILADQIEHFKSLGFRNIHQFYIMPPGYVEWMRRIGAHRSEDLYRRLEEAKDSMKRALTDESYVFILNDDLDSAVAEIKTALAGGSTDEHRAQLSKDTAGTLLEKLGYQDDDF
jgi:guanylate kinase